MSVVAAHIVVTVRIPSPILSAELLMIAPTHVGCDNIICLPTRFVFYLLSAATGSTGPGGPSPVSRGVLQHLCPP